MTSTKQDMFETNEDFEARKAIADKAEREKRWAKEAAQATAADPNECCERVYHGGRWHSSSRCAKPAKWLLNAKTEVR